MICIYSELAVTERYLTISIIINRQCADNKHNEEMCEIRFPFDVRYAAQANSVA